MQRNLIFGAATTAVAMLAAACGGYSAQPAAPSSPNAAPASAATISVASSKLGQILVGGSGRTVYRFEADKGTTSSCYNACAKEWPPVLTSGQPLAGPGATAALLGTTARNDGTVEVTYAGHPLYYFVADTQASDTNGQGVNDSGGLWFVLSPSGAAGGSN